MGTWKHEMTGPTIGTDEVGVGPIAGPITAAAVLLYPGQEDGLLGIRDSKKIQKTRHAYMARRVRDHSACWYVGWCSPEEANDLGPHRSRLELMARCVRNVMLMRPGVEAEIIVDGDLELPLGVPHQTMVKGDQRCLAVSCASVIAKHVRDSYMTRMSRVWPDYGWDTNMGYPTPGHLAATEEHGLSPLHRPTVTWTALSNLAKRRS